jgi:hypothetical protein
MDILLLFLAYRETFTIKYNVSYTSFCGCPSSVKKVPHYYLLLTVFNLIECWIVSSAFLQQWT